MIARGRAFARVSAVVALSAAMLGPTGAARATTAVDITGEVLASHDVALHGDSIVNLPAGTTTYNGVLSGQGTLTVAGSGTLVLTRDSTFTLPPASQHQSVTTSGGNWPYPIVANPDPPAVVVERGATLQYGNGGATGVIGHYPYSWPNISLRLNEDNIQADGTLVLDLNGPDVNLGTISGSGLVLQPRGAWARLDLAGTQPFRGVIGVGTAIGFGDASYRVGLPNARAILNDGSAIFYARDYTLTIPQDFYEQNYGTDINYHTWQAGKIVMTGVDSYSDAGPNSGPTLSDPGLNTRQVAHTVNFRGINIEGAAVQWGDGTTDLFFLPATPADSYINIHRNGSLAFDYDGPVTLDTPISGGVYHGSLSTPAYASVTLSPTVGNAVTFATPQNYHGTTTIGSGATLLLGTGMAGGDSALLTGTAADAIVDDGALVVRDAATPVSLSNITGTGSLTQSGTAKTILTGTTTYTGATTVTSGTLALGPGSSGIGSGSGLTLSGGTFDITAAAPGQTVRGLTDAAGATLTMTPNASGPALNVNGPLNLSGTLTVKPPAGAVTTGERFTLIHTTGPGAVGTFAGLPEGAALTAGGATFQITYRGGTGHDIVLTAGNGASASATAQAGDAAGTHVVAGTRAAAASTSNGQGLRLAALATAAALAALLAGFAVMRTRRRPAERSPRRRGVRRRRRN